MTDCAAEQLPPDIDPSAESDQTEADSEFVEGNGDSQQSDKSGNAKNQRAEVNPELCTDPPLVNQACELERTESTGSVKSEGVTTQSTEDVNVKGHHAENATQNVETPDSNLSDEIQSLAEEDRDNMRADAVPPKVQSSAERVNENITSSQEHLPDLQEALPESLLLPSGESQSCSDGDNTAIQPDVCKKDVIQFETEETMSVDKCVPEEKTIEKVANTLTEPDQPECDINSVTSDGISQYSETSHNGAQSLNVSVTVDGASSDIEPGAVPTSTIPRVSSHGQLGQIQNSVQALIDKTSGFLDSDPPSTMSSMSDLDQAGIDPQSSSKLFDAVRLDTPSPRSLSPAPTTDSSCSKNVAPSNASNDSLQSSASEDNSCLPGNLNNSAKKDNEGKVQSCDADEDLLSELDAELDCNRGNNVVDVHSTQSVEIENPNGLIQKPIDLAQLPEYKKLLSECEMLRKQTDQQQQQIKRFQDRESHQSVQLETVGKERDTLKSQLASFEGKSTDEINEAKMTKMETTIAQQTKELIQTKEKLASHDAAAKRAVQTLQTELKKRVDEVTKLYEETKKEKDAMVMKYAMSEQKSIEAADKMAKNEYRMREIAKEREIMIQRFTQLKKNREAALAALEARNREIMGARREIEMLKEAVSTVEGKTKLANNKLKTEELSHRETKSKLDEIQRKLNEQREEALILRQDCQAMIKTYQESEDIKSTTLDQELKKKESELKQHAAARSEVEEQLHETDEVHSMLRKELESLTTKHKDMIAELKTNKDKVQCLETERRHQEKSLDAFKETLQTQKHTNETMKVRLQELETVEEDMISVKERNKRVMDRNDELEQSNKDLQAEMDGCARREQEHLEFTQKISEKNSSLQSQNSTLLTKIQGLSAEVERLSTLCETLEKKNAALEKELNEEKTARKDEFDSVSSKLAEKSRAAERLAVDLEDQKDENKTLKRRHTANVKDLTRQLQQAKKKLEVNENKESGKDSTSMGSRTSSTTSLETMNNQHTGVSKSPAEPSAPEMQEYPEVRVIEVDKQMLIEKIVKLQKVHARKSEKIEFMDDHINQLLEEVKKKTKIIQMYALREESGTLVPESVDNNKAALAKKTGIMASLYSTHQQDGSMTLELSLEINKKLQAVLEDTLLKNITIKDNLETLGREIARLSQENRQLQLQMQKL